MKATLKFDLSDLDERVEHDRCTKSLDMALALWEINYNLKKDCHLKAEASKKKLTNYDVIEMVFEEIYDLLEDIHIDDLVI